MTNGAPPRLKYGQVTDSAYAMIENQLIDGRHQKQLFDRASNCEDE